MPNPSWARDLAALFHEAVTLTAEDPDLEITFEDLLAANSQPRTIVLRNL